MVKKDRWCDFCKMDVAADAKDNCLHCGTWLGGTFGRGKPKTKGKKIKATKKCIDCGKTIKKEFVNDLLALLRDNTGGCNIQHHGCPCRECFYDLTQRELGLSVKRSHELWKVVLILRGDYTEEEIVLSEAEEFSQRVERAISNVERKQERAYKKAKGK